MGMPTGQGKTWTAHRVSSIRRVRDIRAYKPAEGDGEWLTMSQAAEKLGVSNHSIRSLIKQGLLPAEQVVPRAPYQIRTAAIADQRVIDALSRTSRPCRTENDKQISMFSST
jgi:excisionase family DNA binding protein